MAWRFTKFKYDWTCLALDGKKNLQIGTTSNKRKSSNIMKKSLDYFNSFKDTRLGTKNAAILMDYLFFKKRW